MVSRVRSVIYAGGLFVAGAWVASYVMTMKKTSEELASATSRVEMASESELIGDLQRLISDLEKKVANQIKIAPPAPIATASQAHNDLPPGFCRTSSTGYEILLESLLGSLFQEEGFLPEGSVLDVGAQFGEQACHFATLSPYRTIHALDPSPDQTKQIQEKFAAHLPNLKVTNAGIGKSLATLKVDGPGFTGMKMGDEFKVETIDNLFFDKGEKLAFAHIDVEGRELDTLKGGVNTIKASQPVFTAELRVHQDPEYSKALLDYINELGYDAYVVDEPCGWPHMDYRNLINFPRSQAQKLEFSDAFNLAVATDAIFRVNSKTIFEKVYPCCALGGECCPYKSTDDKQCCHENFMKKWHEKNGVKKPIAMQGFTYSKRHTHSIWKDVRGRANLTPQQAVA